MRNYLFFAVFLAACGSDLPGVDAANADAGAATDATSLVCEPGKQEACACVGGAVGAQRCSFDGNDWGPCKCPDADSGAAPVEDAAISVDSTAPGHEDTGVAPTIEAGAPFVEPCGTWRFIVLSSGNSNCADDGSGTVLDSESKILYTQRAWSNGVKYPQAVTYCESIGGRLPTIPELDLIREEQVGWCAFDCEWQSWAQADDYPTITGKALFTSSSAKVGTSLLADSSVEARVICVRPFK